MISWKLYYLKKINLWFENDFNGCKNTYQDHLARLVIHVFKYRFFPLWISLNIFPSFFMFLGLFLPSFPNSLFLSSHFPFLSSLPGKAATVTLKAPTYLLVPSFSPLPFPAALFTSLWTTLGKTYNTEGSN